MDVIARSVIDNEIIRPCVRVLGRFDVVRNGLSVPIGGMLQQSILARLLVADGPMSVEHLVDDVWTGHPPRSAAASVHAYVSRLRAAMGPQVAERSNGGYRLDRTAIRIDAERFEQAAEAARVADLADSDVGLAARLLLEGLREWSGPDAFGPLRELPFLLAEAHRLEELRLLMAEGLADLHHRVGVCETDVPLLSALLERAPLRESLASRLIRSLVASGRQADALEVFESCRRGLAEEYGVDPGPELRDAHRQLLSLSSKPVPWRLPPRSRRFTGRKALIDEVVSSLGTDGSVPRLVALHGLPGVGKTELALELAHRRRIAGRWAWWIGADGAASLASGLTELARALRLPERGRHDELVSALWDFLAVRGPWVLVFDNVDDPQVLGPMLPPYGNGEIIVTSRNPAWASLGSAIRVDTFAREESRAFVQARIPFGDGSLIDEVAEALGDFPLALDHACAYIDQTQIGLAAYLQLLQTRQGHLMSAGPHGDGRDSVANTWAVAVERVRHRSHAAAELVEMLSFLAPDAISVELLRRDGLDDLAVNEQVAELLRLSLVGRESEHLRIHRLEQTVIRAWLTPIARDQRMGAAITAVVAAARRATDEGRVEWDNLVPHVLALTRHLTERGQPHPQARDLLEAATGCALWLADRSLLDAAIDLLGALIELTRQDADRIVLGCALSALGETLDRHGQAKPALTHLGEAIELLATAVDDGDSRLAHAWNRLGHALNCSGDASAAVSAQLTAIEILTHGGLDNPTRTRHYARVLTDLGYTHWADGQPAAARGCFNRSLVLLASLGDSRPAVAHTLAGLGMVEMDCGDLDQALAHQNEAIALFMEEFGSTHPDVAQSWDKLGYLLRLAGDHDGSLRAHERAVEDLTLIFGAGDQRVAMALSNAGLTYRCLGRSTQARQCQQRAYQIFGATLEPDHPSTLMTARRLAVALAEDGDPHSALQLAHETLDSLHRIGSAAAEIGRGEADLAIVLEVLGDDAAAAEYRARALRTLRLTLGGEHPDVVDLVRRSQRPARRHD